MEGVWMVMGSFSTRLRLSLHLFGLTASCLATPGELTVDPVSYDRAFPALAYAARAEDNAVADFLARLHRGEARLSYRNGRGYLDDLLVALDISPASQVLVFSRTSLQSRYISAAKPRAIYFNEHTYVAWVQGSDDLEVLTLDAQRGPIFFSVHNVPDAPPRFEREALRCLVCHDSAGTRPGGHPRVMVLSSPIAGHVNPPLREGPAEITHATALEDRWGGWFVTGSLGAQLHVGNMPLAAIAEPEPQGIHNRSNLPGLQGYLDMRPYPTDRSDIVALLVLEHQATVQNLVTRVAYASAGLGEAANRLGSWASLDEEQRIRLRPALDELATALTFADERRLLGRITGNAGFESWFAARGPRDAQGRSLHEFDLRRRTFRYPLSHLVYSRQFDALPGFAQDYVYQAITAKLQSEAGDDQDGTRAQALEILAATKPAFAAWQRGQRAGATGIGTLK